MKHESNHHQEENTSINNNSIESKNDAESNIHNENDIKYIQISKEYNIYNSVETIKQEEIIKTSECQLETLNKSQLQAENKDSKHIEVYEEILEPIKEGNLLAEEQINIEKSMLIIHEEISFEKTNK